MVGHQPIAFSQETLGEFERLLCLFSVGADAIRESAVR
jgi:hypothetical protein